MAAEMVAIEVEAAWAMAVAMGAGMEGSVPPEVAASIH